MIADVITYLIWGLIATGLLGTVCVLAGLLFRRPRVRPSDFIDGPAEEAGDPLPDLRKQGAL